MSCDCGCRSWHYTERYKPPLDMLSYHGQRGRATWRTISHHYSQTGPTGPVCILHSAVCIQNTARRNRTMTAMIYGMATRLHSSSGLLISDQTIQNRLREVGLSSRRPQTVPPIALRKRKVRFFVNRRAQFLCSQTQKLGGRRLALCLLFR